MGEKIRQCSSCSANSWCVGTAADSVSRLAKEGPLRSEAGKISWKRQVVDALSSTYCSVRSSFSGSKAWKGDGRLSVTPDEAALGGHFAHGEQVNAQGATSGFKAILRVA